MFWGYSRRTLSYVVFVCALACGAWTPMEARSAQAALSWDYTASGAAGFVLYCGSVSGAYSMRIDVGNATSYTVNGLTAGVTYYCVTTAYDAAKMESAYSAEVA